MIRQLLPHQLYGVHEEMFQLNIIEIVKIKWRSYIILVKYYHDDWSMDVPKEEETFVSISKVKKWK